VVDPTLPQKIRNVGNNWIFVLLGVLGAFFGLCIAGYACFGRQPFVVAAALEDCPDEPDRRNVREHMRWRLECEQRKRKGNRISLAFSDADVARYHAVAN
jgi:hypothetical protein